MVGQLCFQFIDEFRVMLMCFKEVFNLLIFLFELLLKGGYLIFDDLQIVFISKILELESNKLFS